MNQRTLGRGLGALLDEAAIASVQHGRHVSAENTMPVAKLTPSDVQPRRSFDENELKALAESIKSQGVLQPLLVRPLADGRYEIIAGERRWRASQLAGLAEVPVIVREMDDGKALEVALVENVQRQDLNPIDEAAGYLRLVNEFNYTHEDMARVTGKSRSHITNLMRLLALPEKIKDAVSEKMLSMGHARALLALSDDEKLQMRAANRIVKNRLSVRETEDLVRSLVDPRRSRARKGGGNVDIATRELEHRVAGQLGMKVAINQKEGVGSIRVFFESDREFAALLQRLGLK